MKNREYINRLLEQKCIDISEQIEAMVENEPRDGYEQNSSVNR